MLRTLVRESENEELAAIENPPSPSFPYLWSSSSRNEKLLQEKATRRKRWEAEEMILDERVRRIRQYLGNVLDPLLGQPMYSATSIHTQNVVVACTTISRQ
jgi:hypothetical protein